MYSLLHCALILSSILLVVQSMPSPEAPVPKLDASYHHRCKPVHNHSCAKHFNMLEEDAWYARFPNNRGVGLSRSLNEFADFTWLLELNNYCSRMLYTLLCFHYFPPCSPLSLLQLIVQPCREVCREATEACLPIARAVHGEAVSIPHHLDCANFQSSSLHHRSSGVVENDATLSNDPTVVLACPNSTIHVDFSPPPGKLTYEVIESAGSLQVCLVLANVGSYDVNATLDIPVSVHLSTLTQENTTMYDPATPEDDYSPVSTTLIFPVGSRKWESVCANVLIINNGDTGPDKSFGLRTEIRSPDSASFGGSAESSAGMIEAVILDDDGMHVGFLLPEGKTMYDSFEDDGYVEICLMLSSEYQPLLGTNANILVTLTPVQTTLTIFVEAEPGLDYSLAPVTVEFLAGSEVGQVQCANVSISVDGLIEADESFSVHATVSPSSVRFVSGQSATADVIIRDDDECVIPAEQCRRNCETRNNATRGMFNLNCYVYVAHVQVTSQRSLQGCSALDVTVLQCWELQEGVCVPNGTRLSIPACDNCDFNVMAGEEYIVGGLYETDVGMFLPNYKKGGLFGEWYDKKYSSMSEWVQDKTPSSDCIE